MVETSEDENYENNVPPRKKFDKKKRKSVVSQLINDKRRHLEKRI